MSPAIPQIQTYHCICTSLLLSTTHALSSLPRRTTSTGGLDAALILPLPASPPSLSQHRPESEAHSNGGEVPRDPDEVEAQEEGAEEEHAATQSQLQKQLQDITPLPQQGYTILLGLDADRKITLIRREDGFEKRLLHRCSRCRLVVGYTLFTPSEGIESEQDHSDAMDVDGDVNTDIKGKGKAKAGQELEKKNEIEKESYKGKVIYLLPGGIMSTEVMAKGGDLGGGRRIGEEDLGVKGAEGGGVFE